MLVRPAAAGKYPLVLINHGSPRVNADRPGMTPYASLPQIMEFARRGFAVAAVMRRGFGEFRRSVRGIRRLVPESRLLGVGAVGRQGSARCYRASVQPAGHRCDAHHQRRPVGGRLCHGCADRRSAARTGGSDQLCGWPRLAERWRGVRRGSPCRRIRKFGKTSRVPMLWIYADNDLFFGPQVVQRLHQAFTSAGGSAELIKHPAFSEDGHALFELGIPCGRRTSTPSSKRHQLVLREGLLPVPVPKIAVPAGLGEKGRTAFAFYLAAGPHKAFAMSSNGEFGWRRARRTVEEARQSRTRVLRETRPRLSHRGRRRRPRTAALTSALSRWSWPAGHSWRSPHSGCSRCGP